MSSQSNKKIGNKLVHCGETDTLSVGYTFNIHSQAEIFQHGRQRGSPLWSLNSLLDCWISGCQIDTALLYFKCKYITIKF